MSLLLTIAPIMVYMGVEVKFHVFCSSALIELSGQLHAPAVLSSGNEPSLRFE
jgi:hypothetical protein